MLTQATAILQLLDDDEPATVALVKQKLEEVAPVSTLRTLRQRAAGRAGRHLDDLINRLAQRDADAEFVSLCRSFGEDGDLEHACWLLAATLRPGEEFGCQRQALDEWGERLEERLAGADGSDGRAEALIGFFTREIGLRGNEKEYYNIENSILPRVIDSRRGIPITLALVYQFVARRAGLRVDGVSLPGHFIARHEDFFFDPFHGGKRISLEECAALLEQQNLVLTPQHLQPATSRQMLIRILTNLYYIGEQSDPPLAAKISGWLTLLRAS